MHNKCPNENPNGNKYMQKLTLFQNFADLCLKKDPFFMISLIRVSIENMLRLSRKWVRTTLLYALVVCVCVRGNIYHTITYMNGITYICQQFSLFLDSSMSINYDYNTRASDMILTSVPVSHTPNRCAIYQG